MAPVPLKFNGELVGKVVLNEEETALIFKVDHTWEAGVKFLDAVRSDQLEEIHINAAYHPQTKDSNG